MDDFIGCNRIGCNICSFNLRSLQQSQNVTFYRLIMSSPSFIAAVIKM